MGILAWLGLGLACLYGAVSVLAGLSQWGKGVIPRLAAAGLVLSGGLVAGAAVLTAHWLVITGLVLLHALAVANGLHMHGRLNWSHHLVRLGLSLTIVLLILI